MEELRGEGRHKQRRIKTEMKWVVVIGTAGGWKEGKRVERKRTGLYYGD